MSNKFTETFVNLGLLRAEYDTADREPSELAAFNQANAGEQAEILANAEQVVMDGLANVRQAPDTSQDYPAAA
jgi:hypothetical protein